MRTFKTHALSPIARAFVRRCIIYSESGRLVNRVFASVPGTFTHFFFLLQEFDWECTYSIRMFDMNQRNLSYALKFHLFRRYTLSNNHILYTWLNKKSLVPYSIFTGSRNSYGNKYIVKSNKSLIFSQYRFIVIIRYYYRYFLHLFLRSVMTEFRLYSYYYRDNDVDIFRSWNSKWFLCIDQKVFLRQFYHLFNYLQLSLEFSYFYRWEYGYYNWFIPIIRFVYIRSILYNLLLDNSHFRVFFQSLSLVEYC